ncbi:hypothetical protein FISHEDRAFT_70915 [Fistulina hepatica ATCC 64428]|uniref:GH16 domain-containing protein n=1 Tax=Fistulina hepatica ATCC 64428 TaxID=1128425 RepID=A0A0D7AHE1_9AGAR|nr:hypothetical protein FISHEDRAFT_70915 [Fistulina hepatica ATCC 64428]
MLCNVLYAFIACGLAIVQAAPLGRTPRGGAWRHRRDVASHTYSLDVSWDADSIINDWTYFSGADPTDGNVNYQDASNATSKGLAYSSNNVATLQVDDWTTLSPGQYRDSVRVSSPNSYSTGLWVADVAKMPFGCTTWPALWLLGDGTWPAGGEIDIMEGVNLNTVNQMTLHTTYGCMADTAGQAVTATIQSQYTNCTSGGSDDTGCPFISQNTESYGDGFNNAGGGVYATLVDSTGVWIWFFSRSSIPSDLSSSDDTPDPSGWGDPESYWSSESCTMSHFSGLSVIIDTTLGGDWAGTQYPSDCGDFDTVLADPSSYTDAQWQINNIRVYTFSD